MVQSISTTLEKFGASDDLVEEGATQEQMMRKVYELHELNGVPVQALASAYGVSQSTIYNWLKKKKEEFRNNLESMNRVDIISESLQFLQSLKLMALYEASQSRDPDPEVTKEGIVKKRKGVGAELKLKYWSLAKNIESMKIDLMTATGVLLRAPEHIYHTVESEKSKLGEKKESDQRSPEEIKKSIMDLATYGKSLI